MSTAVITILDSVGLKTTLPSTPLAQLLEVFTSNIYFYKQHKDEITSVSETAASISTETCTFLLKNNFFARIIQQYLTSSEHPISTAVITIFDSVGSSGNSTIFRPMSVRLPDESIDS